MEIVRLLHTVGGPFLALAGGLPFRRTVPVASPSGRVKNHDFPATPPRLKPYRPESARVLSGDPAQTVQFVYQSADGCFSAGIWTCEPGCWRIDFVQDEFIHLLEGVVVVTDATGEARTYRAGDAFVSPAGFSGTWDVRERVRKYFTLSGEAA